VPFPAFIDYAARWAASFDTDPGRRHSDDAELGFWRGWAGHYDSQFPPEAYRQSLRTLHELIDPGYTVLDVGSGTGRYAIPLARSGCRVTALDQSPEMLRIARRKAEQANVDIDFIETSWPSRLPEHFDVVLAAWSMYHQRDITTALSALIACADRRVIVMDSIGLPSCHPGCRQNRAIELAGVFAQLGYAPNVVAIHEDHDDPPRAVGLVWIDPRRHYHPD
jgi:SAM-dependent methyltransferase